MILRRRFPLAPFRNVAVFPLKFSNFRLGNVLARERIRRVRVAVTHERLLAKTLS